MNFLEILEMLMTHNDRSLSRVSEAARLSFQAWQSRREVVTTSVSLCLALAKKQPRLVHVDYPVGVGSA